MVVLIMRSSHSFMASRMLTKSSHETTWKEIATRSSKQLHKSKDPNLFKFCNESFKYIDFNRLHTEEDFSANIDN
jgi:hypothetical protein